MTMRLLFIFCLLLALPARAACTAPGVIAPPPAHTQVDLERELEQPWQAGGAIVLYCAADGSPRAGRLPAPPKNQAEETARRSEHFALAKRLNFARKGEAHPLGLPLALPQIELLERFALSDAGAVWFREVADDTLRLFNRGYLAYDRALWKRSLKSGRMPPLSRLLTGKLTETAQFANDAGLFLFSGYAGRGAMAHPGAIGLGDAGLSCQFPSSEELVDPHAIISHEFGHTRYGDPTSAGSLIGEARTVERYENPVRVRNGYEPRTVYFQRQGQGEIAPGKGSLLERLLELKTEHGISVADQTSVERYQCDCFAPLPIMLECEVREGAAGNEGIPMPEQDCVLRRKPGQQTPASEKIETEAH